MKNKFLNFWIRSLISFFFLLNSSCIHTENVENKNLVVQPKHPLTLESFGSIQLASLIYLPSKLPLNDFFLRFKNGEFVDAFKKIDLNYQPSKLNDETLEKIIDAGYVPVFVEITNQGTEPIQIDEKSFSLSFENRKVLAFYSEALPREFAQLNLKAVAANALNIGAVVVGFVAVVGGIIFLANQAERQHPLFAESAGTHVMPDLLYLNDTQKKTKVSYENYLISSQKIQPGASARGLLFFFFENRLDLGKFKLQFSLQKE